MVSTQDSSWRFRIVVKKRQSTFPFIAFFLVCFDGELFAPVHTHQIGLFPLNFILLLKAFYVKKVQRSVNHVLIFKESDWSLNWEIRNLQFINNKYKIQK